MSSEVLAALLGDFRTRVRQPPRPSRMRALRATLTDGEGGLESLTAASAMGSFLLAAAADVDQSKVWIAFGLFMAGVSSVLGFIQRVQLAYFNQKMVWLGAPEPPLNPLKDKVAVLAIRLRVLFSLQAAVYMVLFYFS